MGIEMMKSELESSRKERQEFKMIVYRDVTRGRSGVAPRGNEDLRERSWPL